MRLVLVVVGLVTGLSPCAAPAATTEAYAHGWQLHDQCQDPQYEQGCLGFILGVVDATKLYQVPEICFPENFQVGGFVDLVNAYFVSYPEHEAWSAVEIVADAMLLSFPCPPA